ncbi:MAG TPA: hypothetical protein VHB21_17035, partial [Minicystis sp.]|nr:hypothetical protein [Minicystis sp.]
MRRPDRCLRLEPGVRFGGLGLLAAALGLGACRGCHDEKPYTPYHLGDVASASGAASASATPPPDEAADGGFEITRARAPAGDGRTWPLDAGEAKAPVGRTFALGLELDADGDGKTDLIAWARAPDGLRGELVYASGAAPGELRTVAALPGELAPAGCTAKTSLARVGPRAATFDFAPSCPAATRDRATRWLAVVRWGGGAPEVALELKVGATPEGERLTPSVETADKDGDGRRDVVVTLSLVGAPAPLPAGDARATLVFFDRPAGLARDPSEPEAGLKASLGALFGEARRPRAAAKTFASAEALRRLFAALCEEGGRAIVTTSAGPVRCGELHVASDVALAELEAAVNLGEPVAAAAALARVDALGPNGPRKKDVEKLVAKTLPKITPGDVRTLAAAPAGGGVAGYGPLAFLANGELLVKTAQGVVRADASLAESPAEPRAWPAAIAYPPADPAWRLARVEAHC